MQRAPAPELLLAFAPPGLAREEEHAQLAALAAALLDRRPETLAVTHHCPACGSTEHGAPSVLGPVGPVDATVSLSRAGGRTLLAVATGCDAMGVDLESTTDAARAGFDDVAFSAPELAVLAAIRDPTTATRMRTLGWTAKEALLKAAGTGLRTDPRTIPLTWPLPQSPQPQNRATSGPSPTRIPAPTLTDGAAAGLDPSRTHLAAYAEGDLLITLAIVADRAPSIRWPADR